MTMIPQETPYDNETSSSDIFDLTPRTEEPLAQDDETHPSPAEESHEGDQSKPQQPRIKGDRVLWVLYFAFLATSILFIYSATSTLAYRGESLYAPFTGHLKHVIFSVVVAWGCSRLSKKWLLPFGAGLFLLALLAVVFTPFIGTETNEAKRTLLGFQWSELFKPAVIMLAAIVLPVRDQSKVNQRFYIFCAIAGVGLLFVAKESLSMGIIFTLFILFIGFVQMGLSKSLLLISGIGLGIITLLVAGLLLLPDSVVMQSSSTARWKGRIEDFAIKADSSKFVINEDNFQEQHARIAIARSNGTGVFPGNSVERDILPEAYSDFIYAIIIEETGLIGMIWVPLLYILLFFKLSRWATRAHLSSQRIILLGVGLMYTTQAIIHMYVVAGISPNTGQTLPLISRGGSSLLATSIAIGLCIAVTRHIREEEYRQQLARESVATTTATEETSVAHSEEVSAPHSEEQSEVAL